MGRLTKRVRRALTGVLATVAAFGVIASGLMLPAVPAQAALYNIFPADADGTPQGVFYADSALFATMTSDLTGGMVCIVPADVTDPMDANCDTGMAWGSPNTYVGMGTLLGYPLEAPPLAVGNWRLLITDRTGLEGEELSEVFEVRPCQAECDESAAMSQLQPWKDKAATAGTTVESRQYIEAFDKALQMHDKLMSVATDVLKGGGPLGVTIGIAGGMIESMFANPFNVGKDRAMAIFRPLAQTANQMWLGIAGDPPRFDYGITTEPEFQPVPVFSADDFEPALTSAELQVVQDYAQVTMEASAYGDASRIANERYQGAILDGAYEAAASQAHATSQLTFGLNQRLRVLQRLQAQLAAMPWAQQHLVADREALFDIPEGQDFATFVAGLLAQAQTTYGGGVSAELRAELLNCGFYDEAPAECPITNEMIDYSVALWSDADWVAGWASFDVDATIADSFTEYNTVLTDVIDTYDLFGRWMALRSGEAQKLVPGHGPNQAPVSGFTLSHSEGEAPLTVTLTSTATDPDDDELSLRWDIAGDRFVDDQATVTHTFTEPGTYWISLVATDPEGLWHQAIHSVEVRPAGTAGNRAPVADFTPRTVDQPGPFEQTFTSTSTDPDGDALTHTWYFGDGTTLTGATVTKTFEPGFIMSVLLVVSDGELTAQASGEVTSRCESCGTNEAPVPSFTMDPATGAAPLDVAFTTTSTDPDGDALTHTWHFGDGQTATGDTATHRYEHPGDYTVTHIASDGTASAMTTQTVTVTAAAEPLRADFTVGKGYDAALAYNGAAVLDTGVAQHPTYPVTNILLPTAQVWYTPRDVIGDQQIIVRLGGDGNALLDRVLVTGSTALSGVKTFSVAVSRDSDPHGTYETVIDRAELERSSAAQTFTFDARTARFLKFTAHDNYGGPDLTMTALSAPTVDREGGIVSLGAGTPATIVSASSEFGSGYTAGNVLFPNASYWSTPGGVVAGQAIRVRLGGETVPTINTLTLRGTNSPRSLNEFELWASVTGADDDFVRVTEGALAQGTAAQSFSFAPTDARFVELRMKNNHGDTRYLYLYEMQVLSAHGLNVAAGVGVGAQVVEMSSTYPGYFAADALVHPNNNGWLSDVGAVTDQHLTVLLRDGAVHRINQVTIVPSGYRARNVEVQVSEDGAAFTTVATRELFNTNAEQTIAFTPVDARFVRVRMLDGYHASYIGLQKLRVFALDRGGAQVHFGDTSTGAPVAWAWDFGDGTTSTQQHPHHTFPGPGSYSVSLTVTDSAGDTETTTGTYTVPELPTISVDAPSYTVDEGTTYTLTARDSGVPVVAWDWDFGYAKPNTTSPTTSVRFPADGTGVVTLRGFTADWLWTPPVTQEFTVVNVPPQVHAGNPVTGYVLDPITPIVLTMSDRADTLTCTWDWGDGSAQTVIDNCTALNTRVPHAYALPGTYTATLTADDGDGGVTSSTVTLTATVRATFLQVVQARTSAGDLEATVRLLDSPTGTGISGLPIQVSAGAGEPQTVTTDADGFVTVTFAGASAAESVTASFAGVATHTASAVTRAVRPPRADIVFMVDESGSMGGVQSAVRANLQLIARELSTSLDYRLGLVGYANSYALPLPEFGNVRTPLTDDLTEFYQGVNALVALGGQAQGYEAIVVGSGFRVTPNAADGVLVEHGGLAFRSTAATCLVMISDGAVSEAGPQATSKATKAHATEALDRSGAVLFAISATDADTKAAYGLEPGGLAALTGGDWWSVNDFARDPAPVLEALVEKCVTTASTPDLSALITAPTTVEESAEFTVDVTAGNEAGIDTPGVVLTATVPVGLTFVSASDGGTYSAAARTVTWPAVDLEAGEIAARTMVLRADAATLDPGHHPFTIAASVSYDGSLGDESTLLNNETTATVTVQVSEAELPVDVSVSTDVPTSVEAGVPFEYSLIVDGHGAANAGAVVVQQVPDRLEILSVALPTGWVNEYPDAVTGAHPDGTTPGTWLVLRAPELTANATITVTALVTPLPAPIVIDDDGALDAALPALAKVPTQAILAETCVSADRNDVTDNDCAELRLPLKELVAEVTVRLSDGITFLIVSVDTTAALSGQPVTMTWLPAAQGTVPTQVVLNDLVPGSQRVVPWPGAAFGAEGAVTEWPGWRLSTDADFDSDGNVLDPATGLVMTEAQLADSYRGTLIRDPALPAAGWRGTSTVTFSVNPSVQVPVTYREVVPMADPGPGPEPQPGTQPQPTPTPEGTPQHADKALSATGSSAEPMWLFGSGALLFIVAGLMLLRRRARLERFGGSGGNE